MACQSRIQITTPRAAFQPETRPITARELFPHGLESAEAASKSFGWYLHVPFCFHKCHYCDFYSIVDSRDRQADFVSRLIDELHNFSTIDPRLAHRPDTIFIGGGTPTLLKLPLWGRLLASLAEHISPETEFTVEANPETVTPELARLLVAGGVNRVSIGAQSFNTTHLKTLERWHDPQSVARAVDCFRSAGIKRINLDLIFGIPGQELDEWYADLDAALALEPSHLSCYGLMFEPNTALTARLLAGRINRIDEDVEAAMYEATIDTLGVRGYEHYEISAWARPGERCRHNLLYWMNENWWPFGPSASGHWNGARWKNVPRLGDYLESTGMPPAVDVEQVADDARVGEELMLALRLIEGIERGRVDSLLARGERGADRRCAIDSSVDANLLEWSDDHLRLTRRGLLVADQVITELL